MRGLIWIVASLVAGLVLGTGMGIARTMISPWPGKPVVLGGRMDVKTAATSADEPRPKAQVDEAEFDFGLMDVHAEMEHNFTIRNVGEKPLELKLGATTCKCTLSDLERETIGPGESTHVKLTWHSSEAPGKFEQTATVTTNDAFLPEIKLKVKGRVTTAVRADPDEVDFTRISPREKVSRDFRVYAYEDQLDVLEAKLAPLEYSDKFSVTYIPLTPAQVAEEQDAKGGYLFTVTVDSGLPLGPIQQKVVMKLSSDARPTLEVPVRGNVGSAISVYGQGWDAEKNVLRLGTVSSQTGVERKLLVVVHSAEQSEVTFKPVKIDPELMQVEIGETTSIGAGSVSQTPVIVRIPKGTPPINRSGSAQGESGEILLETNHPQAPQLRILVNFAVGD